MNRKHTGSLARFALAAFAAFLAAASAEGAQITTYTIPTAASGPHTITAGPDGQLWFTERVALQVGAISPGGVFAQEIPVSYSPLGITAVPGNAVMFASVATGHYGFLGVDGGKLEVPYGISPSSAVFAPDGRIWVADIGMSAVTAYHYLSTSPNTWTISLAAPASEAALGPDGRVWLALEDDAAPKLAACKPGTAECTNYPLPAGSRAWGLTGGADGNIWFTDPWVNKIGRMTPDGVLTHFPVPTLGAGVTGICAGPDGNVWFTEWEAGKVGRITKNGVITEYPVPGAIALWGITAGPDGNIWFVDEKANTVSKLQVFVPGDANDDGSVTVADVLYLINFLFAGGPAPE